MNEMQTILLSVLSSGTVVFLFRSWISERLKQSIQHEYDQKLRTIAHEYDQKLETHKAQLKCQTDIEIEKLKAQLKGQTDSEIEKQKSQLAIAAAKHSRTFERTSEVI